MLCVQLQGKRRSESCQSKDLLRQWSKWSWRGKEIKICCGVGKLNYMMEDARDVSACHSFVFLLDNWGHYTNIFLPLGYWSSFQVKIWGSCTCSKSRMRGRAFTFLIFTYLGRSGSHLVELSSATTWSGRASLPRSRLHSSCQAKSTRTTVYISSNVSQKVIAIFVTPYGAGFAIMWLVSPIVCFDTFEGCNSLEGDWLNRQLNRYTIQQEKTLSKAQRTRGLSSNHKFKQKTWSSCIFRISTKHHLQNLNQTTASP